MTGVEEGKYLSNKHAKCSEPLLGMTFEWFRTNIAAAIAADNTHSRTRYEHKHQSVRCGPKFIDFVVAIDWLILWLSYFRSSASINIYENAADGSPNIISFNNFRIGTYACASRVSIYSQRNTVIDTILRIRATEPSKKKKRIHSETWQNERVRKTGRRFGGRDDELIFCRWNSNDDWQFDLYLMYSSSLVCARWLNWSEYCDFIVGYSYAAVVDDAIRGKPPSGLFM